MLIRLGIAVLAVVLSALVPLAPLWPAQGTMIVPSPCAINEAVTDSTPQQLTAVRAGRVIDASKITGHYIRSLLGTEGVTGSLASMGRMSDEVLVGELVSCRSFVTLNPIDRALVHSVFSMRVEEAIRGTVPVGRPISLIVRGGHADLGNGAWLETRYVNFTQPRVGRRYVFFVSRADQSVLVPELKGEAGVFVQPNPENLLYTAFELADGKVQPLLQSDQKLNVAGANRGRAEAEFLAEIRSAVKKER